MTDRVDAHPFLTVQEAAHQLRISRTSGLIYARQWLETAGSAGIPAVRIGRTIRVPRPRTTVEPRGRPYGRERRTRPSSHNRR